MIRRSWRTHLKACNTPEAVLTLVSQYRDEWPGAEIAALPPGAWPARLVTKADLLAHAVELGRMHAGFRGTAQALGGLQELLLFFTHAAVRITQIEALLAAGASPERMPPRRKPVTDEDG